jgi:thiamine biosynthesis lipoprotein
MKKNTMSSADVPQARISGGRRLMGVPWTVTVYAATAAAGERGVAAALDEVERLEAILSDYRADSELSRLSAAAPTESPVPVSDEMWEVLTRAVAFRDSSDGAFDPTVGPLTTLWRQSRRSGVLPLPAKLDAARAAVGAGALVLVDLGGIGMGYAIDRALAILAAQGIDSALVDASGDVGASGAPPGEEGWRIAIDPIPGTPAAMTGEVLLARGAITTSGDARQSVAIGGRRYSHIVDPRTGIGIDGPAAVTVIAADATTADALATAANVLGPVRGRTLLENQAGCAGRFVSVDGDGERIVREVQTSRWPGPGERTCPLPR